MPKKIPVVIGSVFARLTVLEEIKNGNMRGYVRCRCSCGNEITPLIRSLRTGNTTSCGCFMRENSSRRMKTLMKTHGMTNSREYEIWHSMKLRCYLKSNDSYPRYGGRGIEVSEAWKNSFEQFFADMGPRPSDSHSIDRIDTNGHYCKENCRWADKITQQNNRNNNHRVKYKGKIMTIADIARAKGMNYYTLWSQIKVGTAKLD